MVPNENRRAGVAPGRGGNTHDSYGAALVIDGRARRYSAREVVAALSGRWHGRYGMVRCVCHHDHNPSLSIRDGNDQLQVHCFAGCDGHDVLAELQRRGLAGDDARHHDRRWTPRPASWRAPAPPSDRIHALLRRSQPVAGTLAERYLLGRGLDIGLSDIKALRFLPGTDRYPPAMVSLITDFRDAAAALGLQVTSLTADGSKIGRKFLAGSTPKGGVVRLVEDAEVTTELGLAEGTETALAVMTTLKRAGRTVRPCWAALNKDNLADLPVLDGVERLYVYADRDASGGGQRAAETVAQRWYDAGREVFIVLPNAKDWNTAA